MKLLVYTGIERNQTNKRKCNAEQHMMIIPKYLKKKKNDKLLKNKKITAKNNWKLNFWKNSRLTLIQRMRHSRRMYDNITPAWGGTDNTALENFRKCLGSQISSWNKISPLIEPNQPIQHWKTNPIYQTNILQVLKEY